jgi:hypothetical protein
VKEAEGDLLAAITLYLKGGMPGKAAAVVAHNPTFAFQVGDRSNAWNKRRITGTVNLKDTRAVKQKKNCRF